MASPRPPVPLKRALSVGIIASIISLASLTLAALGSTYFAVLGVITGWIGGFWLGRVAEHGWSKQGAGMLDN